ncbi:MAG: hypothetical protein U5L45_24165 [Saprospiraceae bacterium]|nr:hypothetical protein [Saprospiraceae bacterium]
MVQFSASPKIEPHSPPLRERSERKVQNIAFRLCPPLKYLFTRSLRSHKEGVVVHFSGKPEK